MTPKKFSVSWSTYKSSLCDGLAGLQQNEQLVDMTLAADGHFVKVHKVVMALASPYLKDLMATVPCQHPVIFLNDVPSSALSLVLEYIYTGEAQVPAEYMTQFARVGKALRINGLENLLAVNQDFLKKSDFLTVGGPQNSISKAMELRKQNLMQAGSRNFDENRQLPAANVNNNEMTPNVTSQPSAPSLRTDISTENMDCDGNENDLHITSLQECSDLDELPKNIHDLNKWKSKLLYTVSIRGCLQIILNRFIYNLEYTKSRGMQKWRCADYRNNKCPAWLMTKDNIVVNRGNLHDHHFHDKKILDKINHRSVFTAMDDAAKLVIKPENDKQDDDGKRGNHECITGK